MIVVLDRFLLKLSFRHVSFEYASGISGAIRPRTAC